MVTAVLKPRELRSQVHIVQQQRKDRYRQQDWKGGYVRVVDTISSQMYHSSVTSEYPGWCIYVSEKSSYKSLLGTA